MLSIGNFANSSANVKKRTFAFIYNFFIASTIKKPFTLYVLETSKLIIILSA